MKQHSPEEIVTILREADSSPDSVADFCRRKGIAEATLYRWRQKYGNLQVDEAKRLTHRPTLACGQGHGQALEAENVRLKKILAEALLANEGLKELLTKKW